MLEQGISFSLLLYKLRFWYQIRDFNDAVNADRRSWDSLGFRNQANEAYLGMLCLECSNPVTLMRKGLPQVDNEGESLRSNAMTTDSRGRQNSYQDCKDHGELKIFILIMK